MTVKLGPNLSGELPASPESASPAGIGASMYLPPIAAARAAFFEEGFVVARHCLPSVIMAALADLGASVAARHAVHVVRKSGRDTLDYRVVSGDRIKSDARALFAIYRSLALLSWVRGVTGVPDLTTSPLLRSCININCLTEAGQHYPWHADAVPFTAILFLSTVPATAGGGLLIRSPRTGSVVTIQPGRGDLVFMDGARCPHAVASLQRSIERLTVPMVYPAYQVARPAGLDEYLYNPNR